MLPGSPFEIAMQIPETGRTQREGEGEREGEEARDDPRRMRLSTRPWEITAVYAVFALVWIFLSDVVLARLIQDPTQFVTWSSLKGVGFVAVTSLMLLLVLMRAFGTVSRVHTSLLRAREALGNQQRFTEIMLESMPGILYFYDSAGKFLRWNPNFEAVSGYTAEQIAGMQPRDFFPSGERAQIEQRIAEVFERGESRIEASFLARNGTTTPYLFTGRRVLFEGKLCLVGMGIDISARREAEQRLAESELKYRELVEHANSIILRWNVAGRITFLNSYGQRFFGFTAEEIIGQPALGTIVPETETSGRDLRKLIQEISAHPEAYEQNINENMRRNGERVQISWSNYVERDVQGEVREILSIGSDITDRLRIEAEREKRHRAETADRIKSAFLATMSHELRTPLNSIIGFTGIILQGLAGPLTEEQRKQLDMVRGSARHLLALVNDVLDISKIEAGQLEVSREPFDLDRSISKVVSLIRPQAEMRKLAFRVEIPDPLGEAVSDQRRFEQILLNLLSNAVKFTEQGEVLLTARLVDDFRLTDDAPSQPAIQVQVTDTGIGIREDDLAMLFQPFRQIDSGLARRHDGTGLGLAICRRLAGLMGGKIQATSEWGVGSTFTVILPRQRPDHA